MRRRPRRAVRRRERAEAYPGRLKTCFVNFALPEPLQRALTRIEAGGRARVVIEAGERGARLLLVRRAGETVRVERVLGADLRADGLLSPGEMAARIGVLLAELPSAATTLVLPPGRTHSQLIALRPGESRAVADLAVAAGGRQFDAVPSVFDAKPLRATRRHARAMWVSIARDADVEVQLLRCGVPAERIAAIIGADAALAAAFAALPGRPSTAVLIELGASSGVLVVVEDDQPVFAADLDWGSDFLVTALAADLRCTAAVAQGILERDGVITPGPETPKLAAAAVRLRQAVEAFLQDYARESGQSAADLLAAVRRVSGPGLEGGWRRGMVSSSLGAATIQDWPKLTVADGGVLDLSGGAVAYGTAAIALGLVAQPPNLAPSRARAARRTELVVAGLHAVGLAVGVCGLLWSAFAISGLVAELNERKAELAALHVAREATPRVVAAREERAEAGLAALPVMYLQKRTRDLITGVRLLRETRGTADYWFALVTDAETYQAGSLPKGTPSAAPETQKLAGCLARSSGLVVELSFRPGGGDPLGRVGALITELRAANRYARVDILPARARQAKLADPTVFADQGSDYAIELEPVPFDGAIPAAAEGSAATGAESGGLFGGRP
jgi:hypothetical protein